MSETLYFIQVLNNSYKLKSLNNPAYSKRAFALTLGLDASLLNKIMNEKQLPTLETSNQICQALKLNKADARKFMQSVSEEKACVELYAIDPSYTNCH